jgi:excisionase family DNA binding protein
MVFEVKETAFYTVPEISAGLNIAVSGVRSWIRRGKLKAAKVGRAYMIFGKDVLEFLQAGYGAKEREDPAEVPPAEPRGDGKEW